MGLTPRRRPLRFRAMGHGGPAYPPPAYQPNQEPQYDIPVAEAVPPRSNNSMAAHVPAGSARVTIVQEPYCGPITWACTCFSCFCIGPLGLLAACCPCDTHA